MTTGSEWVERFAASLGVAPPTEAEIDSLLGLAGIAAHSSERTAAPLSTWLAGRAGVRPEDARVAAERLAAELGDA
jgi:hypothetical protein